MTFRVLYERWRRFQDNNSDDEDENSTNFLLPDASGGMMSTKVTPRSSPPGEQAGLQKVMKSLSYSFRIFSISMFT